MIIAIKVGGSVFCPGDEPDQGFVRKLAATLLGLSASHGLLVVVGGGRLARKMMRDAAEGATADELHSIGIQAARMNAAALVKELGDKAFHQIPKDVAEVKDAFSAEKIVVAGGFRPGQTTDAVTAQSAEAIGADLMIIGTDVRGVYDKDPKRHDDARFMPRVSPPQLRRMVETGSVEPGESTIVDPVAARLIEENGTKTIVLDIRNLDNLGKAIEGADFDGTLVG